MWYVLAFLAGAAAAFMALRIIGQQSGRKGGNSRVRYREKVSAIITRGTTPQ